MAGVRKDLATLGGPWSPEILWYARAVADLQSRKPNDPTSWTYFAAIHGIDIAGWLGGGVIPSRTSLPPQNIQDVDFNQCQHAGWFFLPWHRGYLAAFEAVIADWIAAQPGGLSDWALPYWNYLHAANPTARDIPPEFLASTWPDPGPNPLLVPRGGTNVLGPQPWLSRDISLGAQTTSMPYTAAPGTVGYGGAISGFSSEGDLTGAVEGDPHNIVHVMVGGIGVGAPAGWMSDPAYAALDPVFWLHHCNIDRLWAAWMSDPANMQESGSPWLNGPFPRQFIMPDPTGTRVVFVPGDTLPTGPLAPVYDDLIAGTGITPPPAAPSGGMTVASASPGGGGAGSGGGGTSAGGASSGGGSGSSLVGANDQKLTVRSAAVRTQVHIDRGGGMTTLGVGSDQKPARYYLNLEGVRGAAPSGVLNVEVSPGPSGTRGLTETVTLFGLARASSTEGRHAGNGLSVAIEITGEIRKFEGGRPITLDSLGVRISQPDGVDTIITVDRVSVYKSAD